MIINERVNKTEKERQASVLAVKAMTLTELGQGRAATGRPDWVETHGSVAIPWGPLGDFIQPAAHSQILLVDCAGCTHTDMHTPMQPALVPLCSPSWYRKRHMHTHRQHNTDLQFCHHITLRFTPFSIHFPFFYFCCIYFIVLFLFPSSVLPCSTTTVQ